MTTATFDIYISCPRADVETSHKLTQLLEYNGFSVWREEDSLFSGNSFRETIYEAIAQSKVVIVIDSKWAQQSEFRVKELDYAKSENIPIIEVLTDNPDGVNSARRMAFSTMLEMGNSRFEEKLLLLILNYGVVPNTEKLYSDNIALREKALINHDIQIERTSFINLLRAAELGNEDAVSSIVSKSWNIDLSEAVSNYKAINSYFIEDLRADLYKRGEIIAEDETVSDNSQRGAGMEKAAFCMMKRAVDMGYEGADPLDYSWYFLEDKDYEECLNRLGQSSRINLHKNPKVLDPDRNEFTQTQQLTSKDNILAQDCQIFISYKRDDGDLVFPIKELIEKNINRRCWIDLDGIESDAQFANVIIKAINSAKVFLFMYSHSHTQIEDYDTDWTVREISFAQKKKKRIVFVNVDGSQLTDWFELLFGNKQQIDASSDIAMRRLYTDLKRWLG